MNLEQQKVAALPRFAFSVIILPTLLSRLEPFIVVGNLFVCALTQHEWFCVDRGFSAESAFAVSLLAGFLAVAVIWDGTDPGHNWIAYRHSVGWHRVLAVIGGIVRPRYRNS